MDFAYVVKTYKENESTYAKVPNIILQQYYDITCYEVRENEDGEESISTTVFKVVKRNRPLDYVYTEPEKYTYKELEERLNNLEATIEEVKLTSEEASVLANEAYSMAETANTTVASFDERISNIEDSPGGTNNVVEF